MDVTTAESLAKESGFEHTAPLDVDGLEFRQDVRDMCNPEHCTQGYGTSWGCPPAARPLEELREKAAQFKQGILVQTIGQLEDAYDFESVMEAGKKHAQAFITLADKMIDETDDHVMNLGAGSCPRCNPFTMPDGSGCTYPDAPCRYPDRIIPSMESSGLYVAGECEKNGLRYNNGENTITFTSCCLF